MKNRLVVLAGCLALAAALAGCAGMKGREPVAVESLRGSLVGTLVEGETGAPVGGAFVYAYRETSSSLVGPSDYISGESAADGSYHLQLLPGDYFVVARKRTSGDNTGPLSTGDLYSETPVTPLTIKSGKMRSQNLTLVRRAEPMFFKYNRERVTDTSISGIIVDHDGTPVAGAFAMAYTSADLKRLPDYASTVTTSDGAFTLYLPKGGTFYLSARSALKGKPERGELYGVYGTGAAPTVTVADHGSISGIRIVLAPFTGTPAPGKPY